MKEGFTEEKKRLVSLDVFRGFTIAAMVLVNNQGDWGHVYPALRHAAWHGWLGADIVFPFFLFALGASLFFPLSSARAAGTPGTVLVPRVLRRTLLLIALGLFLNLFPLFDPGSVRIPGVLQRIGLCYCFAAVLALYAKPGAWPIVTALLLALYTALLLLVTPPGFGRGSLEPCCNLPGFIDGALLAGHTYEHAAAPGFDPEGLLTTIPAVASAMIGAWAASLIRPAGGASAAKLMIAGAVMAAAGLALDSAVPINKNLWTPSYCLFMGGLGTMVFALCHYLFDIRGLRISAVPFLVLGRNAIALYVLSSLAGKAMATIPVPHGTGTATLKAIIFNAVFAPHFTPEAASALYAASFLLFWLGALYLPYRKNIFISI